MSALPQAIAELSVSEKSDLLDALWEDLELHAADLTEAQEAELDGRVSMYRKLPENVVSWESIKQRPSAD